MGWLSSLWQAYLRLLALLGHAALLVLAFGVAAFTFFDQYHHLQHSLRNTVLFGAAFVVMCSGAVRRWIWMAVGLTVPWVALVALGVKFLVTDEYRFEITLPLLLLAFAPPVLMVLVLELLPKAGEEKPAEIPGGGSADAS